jgi:hypothetical protein
MRNHSPAAAGTVPDTSKTSSSTGATRWWQWMLLYPSLAVTIVTAVPSWVDHVQAMKIGVNSRDLAQAQEQRRLWEANLECAQIQEIQRIRTNHNAEVGARVCPTGDVLLQMKQPDAERASFHWVSAKTIEQRQMSALLRPSSAYAAPRDMVVTQVSQSVISQRWLQPGVLKQRVRQGAACFDLVINTYTGSVVRQSPVACTATF